MIWNLIAKFCALPRVSRWLIERAMRRPYSPIVKNGELYMERFWLFNPYPDSGASGADRPRWQFPISIRVHRIVLPDQDRDMHDHPWNARTIILRGFYEEERLVRPYIVLGDFTIEERKFIRAPGDTATLHFGEFHRITEVSPGGAWTLFITGKYRGTWGFLVRGRKIKWRTYLGLDSENT